MFSKIKISFSLFGCLVLLTGSFAYAQTQKDRQVEARVDVITYQAGVKFKEGLLYLKDNLHVQASQKFDEAIEVFLTSGFDLPKTPTLHSCYNQMFETIYQLEYPAINQQQQLKMLSMTCNWQWKESDFQLADAVAKIVLTAPVTPTGDNPAITSKTNTNTLAQGFTDQKYEPSPLDELSQLQLTEEETPATTKKGETWVTISNRTGVSVADLMAANGNAPVPGKKVIIPNGKNAKNITYSRPTSTVRVVKAKAGDTIATLAAREKVSAAEIAKFNGLLLTSKLNAGREIKIPSYSYPIIRAAPVLPQDNGVLLRPIPTIPLNERLPRNTPLSLLGNKPVQMINGRVKAVMDYINEYFNDPYSVRFVRWSKVEQGIYQGTSYWSVQVKLRAKNAFNAYILSETIYYIKNNKVVGTRKLY